MHSTENIPDQIFVLLNEKPYETLSPGERELVHAYLEPAEYNAMHLAATLLNADKVDLRKGALLSQYDRVHNRKIVSLWRTPATLAAAAALVVLLSAAAYFLINPLSSARMVDNIVADTVYLEKKIYVDRVVKTTDTIFTGGKVRYISQSAAQEPIRGAASALDFETVSVSESDAEANEIKGNSVLHDSLWQQFEPVAM